MPASCWRIILFWPVPTYSKILYLMVWISDFYWLESQTARLQPPGQSQLSYTPGVSGIGLPSAARPSAIPRNSGCLRTGFQLDDSPHFSRGMRVELIILKQGAQGVNLEPQISC